MCIAPTPKVPDPPPPPPEAPNQVDASQNSTTQRRRAARSRGTILTNAGTQASGSVGTTVLGG